MFVRTYMRPNPTTVTPDTTYPQAISIMRKQKIRRLPVLEHNRLVGIVVEEDLLSNQPSPATTLSVHEIYSLLESLHIRQIMSRPVVTVEGDCPMEEAARLMVDRRIGCLPVMDGEKLVGIITETDIFKVFVNLLGGEEKGFRLTLHLPNRQGTLAVISGKIADAGGNILAVTTAKINDDLGEVTIKEIGANPNVLSEVLSQIGVEVVDLRSSSHYEPRLFG
jgi:acetoin utilization protein AcuB